MKYYYILHKFEHTSGEATDAFRLSNGQDIRTQEYIGIKEMSKEFYQKTVKDEKRIVKSFTKNDKILLKAWGLSTKHWHYPFMALESEITQEFIEKKFNIKFNTTNILRDKVDNNIYSSCKLSTDEVINIQVYHNVLNLIKTNT